MVAYIGPNLHLQSSSQQVVNRRERFSYPNLEALVVPCVPTEIEP